MATENTWNIGDRVQAGEGEDHDVGNVLEIDGDRIRIGWDTGVQTWAGADDVEEA